MPFKEPELDANNQDNSEVPSKQYDKTTPSSTFNIDGYSFSDMQKWTSTLSPEEFECLHYVDNATQIDCFCQHVIANLDQQ